MRTFSAFVPYFNLGHKKSGKHIYKKCTFKYDSPSEITESVLGASWFEDEAMYKKRDGYMGFSNRIIVRNKITKTREDFMNVSVEISA